MARIRNVKPEFFRHELLQELEAKYPEAKPMLIYIGLWTQSGKNGVFLWKPKQLKLDLLPYVDFNIESSLSMLEKYGFIVQFEQNGKKYGYVPKFILHQAISTREKQAKAPFPDYTGTLPEQGEDSYGIVPTQCQHSVVSDPGTSLHHDIGLHDNGHHDDNTQASPSQSVKFEYPSDFEEFFKAYPKHVEKRKAYKVYKTKLKKGMTLEQLLSSLTVYKNQIVKNKTEEQYIKHPATFINNYEDFIAPPPPPPKAQYEEPVTDIEKARIAMEAFNKRNAEAKEMQERMKETEVEIKARSEYAVANF